MSISIPSGINACNNDTGDRSTVFGIGSTSSGVGTFAAGIGVTASKPGQVALGAYNDPDDDSILSIGAGTGPSGRKTALKVNSDGSVETSGGKVNTTLISWNPPSSGKFLGDWSDAEGAIKVEVPFSIVESTGTLATIEAFPTYNYFGILDLTFPEDGFTHTACGALVAGSEYVTFSDIANTIGNLQANDLGIPHKWEAKAGNVWSPYTLNTGFYLWSGSGAPTNGWYPTAQDSTTKKITAMSNAAGLQSLKFYYTQSFEGNETKYTITITVTVNGSTITYSDIPCVAPAVSSVGVLYLPVHYRAQVPNGEIKDYRYGSGSKEVLCLGDSEAFWTYSSQGNYVYEESAGYCPSVEGSSNYVASSPFAHVEGHSNYVSGTANVAAHVEGAANYCHDAKYAHVEGGHNYVSEDNYCHVEGRYNIANYQDQHVGGVGNADVDGYEVIGMGTVDSTTTQGKVTVTRKNARVLTKNGCEQARGFLPLTTVTAVPTAAPSFVGEMQWDSTNKRMYFATGTSAVSDWKVITLGALPS